MERELIYSVIALAVLFVGLLLTYRLRWRDFRLVGKSAADDAPSEFPRISVLIPFGRGEHDALLASLPQIFEQDYPDFEVIVIDQGCDVNTEELTNELQNVNKRIRLCTVPHSARHIAQGRFALMLGARAAHSDLLLFMTPSSTPSSESLLRRLASALSEDVDAVLGYCNFLNTRRWGIRRAINARLREQILRLRAAKRGVAMGAENAGVLIRKDAFLASISDLEGLRMPIGEIDLNVERLGVKGRVRVLMSPETTVLQDIEYRIQVSLPFVTSTLTRGKKSARVRRYYRRDAFASWMLWMSVLAMFAYFGIRMYSIVTMQAYQLQYIAPDVVWFLLILTLFLLPTLLMRNACKRLGECRFGVREVFYELGKPLRSVRVWSRVRRVMRRFAL